MLTKRTLKSNKKYYYFSSELDLNNHSELLFTSKFFLPTY